MLLLLTSLSLSVAWFGWLMGTQVMANAGCLGRFHQEDLQVTKGLVPFYHVLDSALPTGLAQVQTRCLWHLLQSMEGWATEGDEQEQGQIQTGLCLS